MTHHRRAVHAQGAPEAIGPYSHAVAAGGLLFCSGQIPLDPATGELIDGGAGDQAQRCLESLAAVCEAAGASLADAVRITVYLENLNTDWDDVNEVYASYFEADPPARVAVGVKALPKQALVEMDAVVAFPD